MSDLRELYQEIIIDHGRHPRNFGPLHNATCCKEGFNPLCGDKIKLYILENNQMIEKIQFEGSGCAISMASASLLTEHLLGKSRKEIQHIFDAFHRLVTQKEQAQLEKLGKLSVLAGVAEFPVRVKCATLPWHTLMAAINNKVGTVSTEETV